MTYEYLTQYNSPNYFTPEECRSRYGLDRSIESITIHHWGDPKNKPQFAGIVSWLCRENGDSSAGYVVEAGRVACIIDDKNAAWHSGSGRGNATSIGIELNPRESDGDYATAAELISKLRARYGDLPLHPHRFWVPTECPGTYDLARLDALARGKTPAPAPPKPTPKPSAKWVAGLNVVSHWQEFEGTTVDGRISQQDAGNKSCMPAAHWTTVQWVTPGHAKGSQLIKAAQRRLDVPADGIAGPITWKAIQGWLGVTRDGIAGDKTIAALAHKVGAV